MYIQKDAIFHGAVVVAYIDVSLDSINAGFFKRFNNHLFYALEVDRDSSLISFIVPNLVHIGCVIIL